MMIKRWVAGAVLGAGLAMAGSAAGATYVAGSLYFGWNPNNYYYAAHSGLASRGYGNFDEAFVLIGDHTEFGVAEGGYLNTADFTEDGLTVRIQSPWAASFLSQSYWAYTPGFFDGVTLRESNFTGLNYSVRRMVDGWGNELDYLRLDWDGSTGPGDWTAQYSFGGAVPEPQAWALMILGFGGVGALMRRQRRRSAAA